VTPFRVNLGGEGEELGVLNQQGPWALHPTWRTAVTGQTLEELCAAGNDILICPNTAVALPDGCAAEVITNNLPPFDSVSLFGPTVQTSEVERILMSGGVWINNGIVKYVKP
jgi:hypothetical protein